MLEADEIAEEAAAEDAEITLKNGRNDEWKDGSKQQLLQADPCMDKHCDAGRVCKVCIQRESLLWKWIVSQVTGDILNWISSLELDLNIYISAFIHLSFVFFLSLSFCSS